MQKFLSSRDYLSYRKYLELQKLLWAPGDTWSCKRYSELQEILGATWVTVLLGIEKTALWSFPVTKQLYRIPAHIGNLINHIEVQLGGVKPSWNRCMYHIDFLNPPPLTFDLPDMWGELYIYWVLRNNSSEHSVAVTQSCDTLVLTSSSSLSSATNLPSLSYPEKE
jgi:hypothetical protein